MLTNHERSDRQIGISETLDYQGLIKRKSAESPTALPSGYKKKGKLSTSHRYNLLPLLPSDPGGV